MMIFSQQNSTLGWNRLRTLFLVALCLAFCLSCSSSSGDSNDNGNSSGDDSGDSGNDGTAVGDEGAPLPPAGASSLRVTSFNAGLLPLLVPRAEERVSAVAQAVAAHNSDVICLQEVWQPSDLAVISNAIRSSYPSIVAPAARQKPSVRAPVCSSNDLEPTVSCVISNCLLASVGVFECLIGTCHDQLETLAANNPECAQAITAQQGKSSSDVLDIQAELFSNSPAGLFAFEGAPGVVLASKLPLESAQVVDFFDITTVSRRVGVLATVTKNGVRHRVGCTHLQSNLDGLIPYTGALGSWGGEQRGQGERFRDAALAYGGADPIYLAGDFNCSFGVSSSGVASELTQTCEVFTKAGFADPATAQLPCTFCSSNNLVAENSSISESRDTLLDHVFVKNPIYSGLQTERVFTEIVTAGGSATNLSDHFGVRLSAPVP